MRSSVRGRRLKRGGMVHDGQQQHVRGGIGTNGSRKHPAQSRAHARRGDHWRQAAQVSNREGTSSTSATAQRFSGCCIPQKRYTHRMAIICVRPQGSNMEGTSSTSAAA